MLAGQRCRSLANRFERLFMAVPAMPELSQDELAAIARAYFRDLLIEGNDQRFWLEEMWGNDPSDRKEAIESAGNRESALRELHQDGKAATFVATAVQENLMKHGHSGITSGSDTFSILSDYFVRARIESARIQRAKLTKDYPEITPRDPLYTGIMDDTLPPLPGHTPTDDGTKSLLELVDKFKEAKQAVWAYKSGLDYDRVLRWFVETMGDNRPVRSISTQDIGLFRDVLLRIPKNYSKAKNHGASTLKQAMEALKESPVLSPRTAEKYLDMARAFLNWCESEGHIDKAPGQKSASNTRSTKRPGFRSPRSK